MTEEELDALFSQHYSAALELFEGNNQRLPTEPWERSRAAVALAMTGDLKGLPQNDNDNQVYGRVLKALRKYKKIVSPSDARRQQPDGPVDPDTASFLAGFESRCKARRSETVRPEEELASFHEADPVVPLPLPEPPKLQPKTEPLSGHEVVHATTASNELCLPGFAPGNGVKKKNGGNGKARKKKEACLVIPHSHPRERLRRNHIGQRELPPGDRDD